MKAIGVLAAIAVALTLQATLSHALFANRAAFDLVLVLVIFVALGGGPAAGLLTGTAAGLLQDALAGGVVGIGSLAKSLVGFVSGAVGTHFIVTGAPVRFVVFVAGSLGHAVIALGLARVIDPRSVLPPAVAVLTQAVLNGAIGVLAFEVVEQGPGWIRRRRLRRSEFVRRWRA